MQGYVKNTKFANDQQYDKVVRSLKLENGLKRVWIN